MLRYPMKLTKEGDTFIVSFPDVPEAHTFGEDVKEAKTRALDALLTAFDAYMKDRRPIPRPSLKGRHFVTMPPLMEAKLALYDAMREQHVNKSELSRRLKWHLPQVDRVLNVRHASRLDSLEEALAAVKRRMTIQIEKSA